VIVTLPMATRVGPQVVSFQSEAGHTAVTALVDILPAEWSLAQRTLTIHAEESPDGQAWESLGPSVITKLPTGRDEQPMSTLLYRRTHGIDRADLLESSGRIARRQYAFDSRIYAQRTLYPFLRVTIDVDTPTTYALQCFSVDRLAIGLPPTVVLIGA
jgi:hypothetical protein